MRIILAPMQGVVDFAMREMLTGLGGYDRCVTEFVRVTDHRFPSRVFQRYCPELSNGGKTASGTPVYTQLLGSNAKWMAENAAAVARLGAPGIDLNFGCPAKTVNRSDGGSVLLKEPKRVASIVAAVRNEVDADIPVTAKIRLGFNDCSLLRDIVAGIVEAGATELCIHARTREDGYKPPAKWGHIKAILDISEGIPVITNGDIYSVTGARHAQIESGCQDIMLGRGALACPDLARQIKRSDTPDDLALTWLQILDFVENFFDKSDQWSPRYVGNRTKQWLAYLRKRYAGAELLFQQIKGLTKIDQIKKAIAQHRLDQQYLAARESVC